MEGARATGKWASAWPWRPVPAAAYDGAMTREEALAILHEFTADPSLRKHALAVEAALRHHAALLGGDTDLWGVIGLLHDFDYEKWPDPPDHTRKGAEVLRERSVDPEIVGAILSHADWNLEEYPRDRPVRKALFAVDELCGFILAAAYVRPEGLATLEPKSVLKKMKQKAFAAAVNRDDIRKGAELLGVPLEEHIARTIAALRPIAKDLGLPG
jgi:putative nucleotidyltransferase with HDIG domain